MSTTFPAKSCFPILFPVSIFEREIFVIFRNQLCNNPLFSLRLELILLAFHRLLEVLLPSHEFASTVLSLILRTSNTEEGKSML